MIVSRVYTFRVRGYTKNSFLSIINRSCFSFCSSACSIGICCRGGLGKEEKCFQKKCCLHLDIISWLCDCFVTLWWNFQISNRNFIFFTVFDSGWHRVSVSVSLFSLSKNCEHLKVIGDFVQCISFAIIYALGRCQRFHKESYIIWWCRLIIYCDLQRVAFFLVIFSEIFLFEISI